MIKDEFSKPKYSRQRRYQLRNKKRGKCLRCPSKATVGVHCLKHAVMAREWMRERTKAKRRLAGSKSYKAEHKENGNSSR